MRSFVAPGDSHLSAVLVSTAAIALGYALQLSNGTLNTQALTLLSISIGLVFVAALAPRFSFVEQFEDSPAVFVLAVGLVIGLGIHLTTPPGVYLRVGADGYVRHHEIIAGIALLAGAGLSKRAWLGNFRIAALLVLSVMLGLWLLTASPSPFIDVYVWHREAYTAFGQAVNPYGITMSNIYGSTQWFAPGLADATHVFVGYPYPPLTFLLNGLGHLAADDYRYANLAALVIAQGMIAFARPGRIAPAAAAILILSPRSLFVLEQGWTEATAIFAFALTVFCACRFPRLLPWAFGAMLATKQYFILLAPLAFLLMPGPFNRKAAFGFAWRALLVPIVITLPFFAWGPKAFIDSVLLFQVKQPFRPDSLSFLAWTAKDGALTMPKFAGFAAMLPVYAIGVFRAPRTPFGFAACSALLFLVFFAFSKQAFCNYYFLSVGILCAAAAALHRDDA